MNPTNLFERLDSTFDVKANAVVTMDKFVKMCQAGRFESLPRKCRLTIYTHAAKITGELCDKHDTSIENTIAIELKRVNDEVLRNLPGDLPLTNQGASLLLKDVTLTPYSAPENELLIGFIQLFTDQIVGVSVG